MISILSTLLFASAALDSLPSGNLPISISTQEVKGLIEIDKFSQLIKEIEDPKTLIFIDIDDTLIDFETHIGSKQWRSQIKKSALNNYHDNLTLYIAKQITMVPVEKETPAIIKKLQKEGHFLFPFTARERDCWYDLREIPQVDELTHQALLKAQMDFTQTSRPSYFDQMNQEFFYK
jgi:hypothetical protein